MSAIVVRQRSLAERVSRFISDAIPDPLQRLVSGPLNRLIVDGRRGRIDGPNRRLKPVEILVDPAVVLVRRLRLPPEGKAELRSAIELLVRSMTPFEPDELLIHAAVDAEQSGSTISYTLHMVPRNVVAAGLAEAKFRPSAVRSVRIDADSASKRVDLVEALVPSIRWRRWILSLPVAVFLVAAAWVCSNQLGDLQAEEMALQDQESQLLAHVKSLTSKVEQTHSAARDAETAATAFASAQSAYLLLLDLRSAQPSDIDLQRLDVREDGARLTVRTPDALASVKGFASVLPKRAISIDGTILADPSSGLETAVILIGPEK